MKAKTWATGLGTAVIAGALAAGIPVPASAQPVPGPEEFTVIVAGNAPQLFIARGTLDAAGTAVPVSGGTNGGVDKVQLPGGTFTLTLQNTSGSGTPVNPVTCIATFHGAGISTISDGTGRMRSPIAIKLLQSRPRPPTSERPVALTRLSSAL